MNPILAINLKTYAQSTGKKAVEISRMAAQISAQKKMRVIVLPQSTDLRDCAKTGAEIFGQHCDEGEPGRHTGHVLLHAIRDAGAAGVLLNHAEHKLNWEILEATLRQCRDWKMKIMVCSDNFEEMKKIIALQPTYIAYEIPELIGTAEKTGRGKSITDVQPENVHAFTRLLAKTKIIPLCGAGVSTPEDVRHALALGTHGALIASAIAGQANPSLALKKLAIAFSKKK